MDIDNGICPISNVFHSSEQGCTIISTADNRKVHIFNKTKISISHSGIPLYKCIRELANGIESRFTSINAVGGQVCVLLPKTYITLSEYLTSIDRCLDMIIEMHKTSQTITHILKNEYELDNVSLSVKSMFDCFVEQVETVEVDNTIPNVYSDLVFFRPVSFTHLNREYYIEFQKAIFNLFSIAIGNIKAQDVEGLADRKFLGKNQKICNASYFVAHPSELLDCRLGTKNNCMHIADYLENVNKYRSGAPLPKCKKLWRKLNDEGKLTQLVKFECQHPPNTSTYLQNIFGRSHRIHTILCFPSELLDMDWYSLLVEYLKCKNTES